MIKIKFTELKTYVTKALINPTKDVFFKTMCQEASIDYCLSTVKIKLMTQKMTDAEIKDCIRLLAIAGVKLNASPTTNVRTRRKHNPKPDNTDAGNTGLAGS